MTDSRAKGDRAEREVVKLLTEQSGFHVSRARTPGEAADCGDILGVPETVVEVKWRASVADSIRIGIPQALAAAERTGQPWATVWVRLPRGGYVVAMTPEHWLAMHREATTT